MIVGNVEYEVRRADQDDFEVWRDGVPIGAFSGLARGVPEHVNPSPDATVPDMRALYAVAHAWFQRNGKGVRHAG